MWGKVSCLRKQHDDRDWALNPRPSDLKSNVLTTTPLGPHSGIRNSGKMYGQEPRYDKLLL